MTRATTGQGWEARVAHAIGAFSAFFGCSGDGVYVLGRLPAGVEAGSASGGGPGDASIRDSSIVSDASAPLDVSGSADARFGTAPSDASPADGGLPCSPPTPVRDYAFDGFGTEVIDRQGGPPGQIRGGATLEGSGELVLDGEDDYVDLPNGLLTGLDEATVAVWVRYHGGAAYTRIFDFGVGSDGEDPSEDLQTVGTTYLSLTPGTGFVPRYLAALISRDGAAGEIALVTNTRLDEDLHLVAVAVASTTLELFHDGTLIGRVPNSVPLGSIENVNTWLGRSQYDQDPYLRATYAGVRLFDRALPECAVRGIHELGPRG